MLLLSLFPISVQTMVLLTFRVGLALCSSFSKCSLSHTRRCDSLMSWARNHHKPFATFYSESCGALTHWKLRRGALSA